MTAPFIRYAEKFTSSDGLTSYTFPTDGMEYEPEQGFRSSLSPVIGTDYAYDFLGSGPWAKEVGEEPIRCIIWGTTPAAAEAEFDSMVSTLRKIGRGKLYTLDSDGSTRRWCWAKLAARPTYAVEPLSMFNIPVMLRFLRLSDWYSATQTTGSQALSATPTTFSITNAGNGPVRAAIFRLRASGATGFTDPLIENLTNGYSIASTRDAVSANSELKFDAGTNQALWSDDDGSSYVSDYDKVTLGTLQGALMRLEVGSNSMRYTDGATPNATLEWAFYPVFE